MPNPNALIARVHRVGTATEAARPAVAAAPQRLTVDFEGDRTAILPASRRAAAWRDMPTPIIPRKPMLQSSGRSVCIDMPISLTGFETLCLAA